MEYRKLIHSLFLFVLIFTSCKTQYDNIELQNELGIKLTDSLATKGTVLLFYNLQQLAKKKVIFGHHHTTAYGVKWRGDENRSDVKDVTGSFPGLYGWDFNDIAFPEDTVRFDWTKKLVEAAKNRGGVNIFAWHYFNPVTDQIFYDTTIAVKYILPGGSYHPKYKRKLDELARYSKNLIDKDGKVVPIVFRPYHEMDGSWFWWGKHFCTPDEFKELFRFTVDYLRNTKNVRNMLFAFSPDRNFYNEEEYLERYPGDEYVDIFGMDDYYDFSSDGDGLEWITKKLRIITKLAEERNKIAAFTETGSESIPDPKWWTDKLYKTFDDDSVKIAFVMVWRNANTTHHYAPYEGHPSSQNFIEFKNKPKVFFQDELPDLYNKPLGLN